RQATISDRLTCQLQRLLVALPVEGGSAPPSAESDFADGTAMAWRCRLLERGGIGVRPAGFLRLLERAKVGGFGVYTLRQSRYIFAGDTMIGLLPIRIGTDWGG